MVRGEPLKSELVGVSDGHREITPVSWCMATVQVRALPGPSQHGTTS